LKYQQKISTLPSDYHQQHPVTAGLIEQWDTALGKILDVLEQLGIAKRTIVVLYSDNGGWVLPSGEIKDLPMTSNAPLRAGKSSLYEGGTRVPLVIVWPGHVEPGSSSGAIFSGIDLYPTFLAMLGRKPVKGAALDGVNQMPALLGKGAPRKETYCYFPSRGNDNSGPGAWIRKEDWKLLVQFARNKDLSDNLELYYLKNDIGESTNLAEKYPEKTKELHTLLFNHLRDAGAVLPVKNPNYKPGAVNPNNNQQK